MIQQIADLEWDENLSFEEAFSKAKESWKGEFKMVNYWLFSNKTSFDPEESSVKNTTRCLNILC
jgi:hypothetical protein